MESIKENLAAVDARIRTACARAGRGPADVRLIWVSKNHPREKAIEALALGARIFGENRVQEALEKFPLPPDAPGAPGHQLHLIGRLQKNKIRKILPLITAIHSIDSVDLLEAVNRIAGEENLHPNVFLQVNTSREPAKGGFEPDTLLPALAALPPLPHLRIVGLMTMGPLETQSGAPAGPEEARACFRELKRLLQAARDQASTNPSAGGQLKDLAWLSMGMSGDFEVAIEEGADFIRVGTALFGAR